MQLRLGSLVEHKGSSSWTHSSLDQGVQFSLNIAASHILVLNATSTQLPSHPLMLKSHLLPCTKAAILANWKISHLLSCADFPPADNKRPDGLQYRASSVAHLHLLLLAGP